MNLKQSKIVVNNSNHIFVNLSFLLLSKIASYLENYDRMLLAFVCKRWMISIDNIISSFKLDSRFLISKDLKDVRDHQNMKIFRNLFTKSLLSKDSFTLSINASTNLYSDDYIINKCQSLDKLQVENNVTSVYFDQLPESLMVSLRSFIERHPNINEIHLDFYGLIPSIAPNMIPKQIKRIIAPYRVEFKHGSHFRGVILQDGSLPEGLEYLELYCEENPISNHVIPKSVKTLRFIGHLFQIDYLPPKLEKLILHDVFHFNINPSILPHTLRKIHIPADCVPKLKNLTNLEVICIINEPNTRSKPLPFSMSDIPPSVTTLKFLKRAIFDIPNSSFPPTIRNLYLGECLYNLSNTNESDQHPFFLENAQFDYLSIGKTLRVLNSNELPSKVKSLKIVNRKYQIHYNTGCFPESLGMTQLKMRWPSGNKLGLISNTVKRLTIIFQDFGSIEPGEIPNSVEYLRLKNLISFSPSSAIPPSVKVLHFKNNRLYRVYIRDIIYWIENFLPNTVNTVTIPNLFEMTRLKANQFILVRFNDYESRKKFKTGIISLKKLSKSIGDLSKMV